MLIIGATYVLLGCLCIQKVMERVRRDEKLKWKEYYEKVQELQTEREEEEEREWLLEHHGGEISYETLDGDDNNAVEEEGGGRRSGKKSGGNSFGRCWQGIQRWWWRCKRRRRYKGSGSGICYQLGCRAVDCRC